MKIFFCLLFSIGVFAQTTTEYNPNLERFEYRDNYGNLIGIKTWDSYKRVWVYTQIAQQYDSYNKQPINYGQPINTQDVDLLGKIATIKQERYNANFEKISRYIENLRNSLTTDSYDIKLIQNIENAFNSYYVDVYYSKNYDLSSNSVTSKILNWLKEGFNKIVFNKIADEQMDIINKEKASIKKGVPAFTSYYGGYTVPLVEEYVFQNKKWILVNSDKNNVYIFYGGDIIYFKKGDNKWMFRQLDYKEYDEKLKVYIYTSQYGKTIINNNFTKIIFYESSPIVKKYIYTIGNYDGNIKSPK